MAKRTTMDKEMDRLLDGRDRELIRISAKALGELALPTFCPRCFWLKRRMRNELPFRQPLPGVFSAIDSITKRVVHGYFDKHGHLPPWLTPLGEIVRYHEPPHWSRFNTVIEEHGILLTGAVDGIFERRDGSYIIVDYKTARFTPAQDALLPMYEVQLNAYALIAERQGFAPVSGLFLVYMEPETGPTAAAHRVFGISMSLSAYVHEVAVRPDRIDPLFVRACESRESAEPPLGGPGCPDCLLVVRFASVVRSFSNHVRTASLQSPDRTGVAKA
jgi:hypothetical protein